MIKQKIFIGTAGWSYEDWKGVVYPEDVKSPLSFMMEYFDCLEINSSFYRIPDKNLCYGMARSARKKEGFTYITKLYQGFTHKTKEYTQDNLKVFINNMQPMLEDGHNQLLIQFPFFFQYNDESKQLLSRISADFSKDFSLILEVRHNSFDTEEAFEFISSHHYNISIIDAPQSKTSFTNQQALTGNISYFRLHGRNYKAWFSKNADRDAKYDYTYSSKELSSIVERIQALVDKVERIFIIANNHYKGQAPANALQIKSMLLDKKVSIPPLLVENYDFLEEIAQD